MPDLPHDSPYERSSKNQARLAFTITQKHLFFQLSNKTKEYVNLVFKFCMTLHSLFGFPSWDVV